jgi:hypothetical protein
MQLSCLLQAFHGASQDAQPRTWGVAYSRAAQGADGQARGSSFAMHPPPPRAPSVAVVPKLEAVAVSPESFVAPSRRVLNRLDLAKWQASPARAHLLGFVRTLADAARGVSLSADVHVSPAAAAVIAVLEELQARSRASPTSAAAHTHVHSCWLYSVGWMLFHRCSRRCGMETPRSGPGVCPSATGSQTAESLSQERTLTRTHTRLYLEIGMHA